MRRFVFGSLAVVGLTASFTHATVIETFDTPNTLSTSGTFTFTRDGGSFTTSGGGIVTRNPTNFEIAYTPSATANSGYGTGYHSIYSSNTPPPGSGLNNGVVDISSNSMLTLDVTINSGTAGLFIDLQDGSGTLNRYLFGYGLTPGGVAGNAAPQVAGEIITQGADPNELILSVPLATPASTVDADPPVPFDPSQIVLFRIENDPVGAVPYDISFNDLSATGATPEPASLAACTALGGLLMRRRRRA